MNEEFDTMINEFEYGEDYTHKIKWMPGDQYPWPNGPSMVSDIVLACTSCGTYITVVYNFNKNAWCYVNGNKLPHTVNIMQWFNIPEPIGGRYQDIDWNEERRIK